MVEEVWKLVIEAYHLQGAFSSAPIGTPSVCQLHRGPCLKVDPHSRDVVCLEFCLMLLCQKYDIDNGLKYR